MSGSLGGSFGLHLPAPLPGDPSVYTRLITMRSLAHSTGSALVLDLSLPEQPEALLRASAPMLMH